MKTPLVSFVFHKIGQPRYRGDVYSLPQTHLRQLIDMVADASCQIINWEQLISPIQFLDGKPFIALTFDDGYESDFMEALPLLQEMAVTAAFFLVPEWIGKPGFLSWEQVSVLSECGMAIGSHTLKHPWLPELTQEDLHIELRVSRQQIEDLIQKPVSMLTLPGGYYTEFVMDAAWEAGYKIVGTSDYGIDYLDGMSDQRHLILKRNCMDLRFSWGDVNRLISGEIPLSLLLKDKVKRRIAKTIGPSRYKSVSDLVRLIRQG